MMGAFTLFCVLYEGVEAIQRMVDPHHREGASVITMDEEQPWALGVLGVVLNAAAAIVFRQHRMHGLSLGNFSSVEDGGFAGGGSFSRKGVRAQRTSRRGRDDLLEGVFVLAVAELSGRLAGGLGGDGWGYSLLEDCAALVAALIGGAVALPLTVRTARLLLQASPAALQHRLSRAMIEGGLLDGVVECRCPHFWEQAPGRCVGSLVVRLRRGADEQSVRGGRSRCYTCARRTVFTALSCAAAMCVVAGAASCARSVRGSRIISAGGSHGACGAQLSHASQQLADSNNANLASATS